MLTTYKNIVIEDAKGPPEAAEIAAIEKSLGAALPSSFRQFVDVANGGRMAYSVRVPPTPDGEELLFGDLFLAGKDAAGRYDEGTMMGESYNHRSILGIPDAVLPFARDGGDSTVYLDLTEEGQGRVVAFVIGLPSWTGQSEEDVLVEVAPSFDEYLSLLYLDDDFVEEMLDRLTEAINIGDAEEIQTSRAYLDSAIPDWRMQHPHLA